MATILRKRYIKIGEDLNCKANMLNIKDCCIRNASPREQKRALPGVIQNCYTSKFTENGFIAGVFCEYCGNFQSRLFAEHFCATSFTATNKQGIRIVRLLYPVLT